MAANDMNSAKSFSRDKKYFILYMEREICVLCPPEKRHKFYL